MGNHGMVSAKPRSADTDKRAEKPAVFHVPSSRALTLRNWPVSWRLIAVIVLTLVMGLVTAWPYLRRGSDEPAV